MRSFQIYNNILYYNHIMMILLHWVKYLQLRRKTQEYIYIFAWLNLWSNVTKIYSRCRPQRFSVISTCSILRISQTFSYIRQYYEFLFGPSRYRLENLQTLILRRNHIRFISYSNVVQQAYILCHISVRIILFGIPCVLCKERKVNHTFYCVQVLPFS